MTTTTSRFTYLDQGIDTVMADSADLVEVVHTLHQIINVKGD